MKLKISWQNGKVISLAVALSVLLSFAGLLSALAANTGQCLGCSSLPLKSQKLFGDRSIKPMQVFQVSLVAGDHLRVLASGSSSEVGMFDVTLYEPQTGSVFSIDGATCLVRAVSRGVTNSPSEPPKGIGSCGPDAPISQPPSPPLDAKGKPVKPPKPPAVTASKAEIDYAVPINGNYFIVVEFYGSGVEISFSANSS